MSASGALELSITLGDATFTASGSSDIVMSALTEFKAMLGDTPSAKREARKPHTEGEETNGKQEKKTVLPLFIKDRNPKGNPLTATAIVAWAQLHGDRPDGITAAEALKLWKTTSMKPPGNLSRDMASAAKDGLLEKKGPTYTTTGHGKTQLGLSTH
jgi:hypothetical protein